MALPRALFFDLDDTLLRRDKTLAPTNRAALARCRERGIFVGLCTSRGEGSARLLAGREAIPWDILITSAGALARVGEELVYETGFTADETSALLSALFALPGPAREMTADTVEGIFHSYDSDDPTRIGGWKVDFRTFSGPALKICAELGRDDLARQAASAVAGTTFVRFAGEDWYAFRKAGATKASAIRAVAAHLGLEPTQFTAFGDDLPDVDMLTLCGVGVAMGNAQEAVKASADVVIGDCDSDAIARYLEGLL